MQREHGKRNEAEECKIKKTKIMWRNPNMNKDK